MSVSSRIKNAAAAAGLAVLALSFTFNSAAARPADDMLPAPAPVTTPVDETAAPDAQAEPELKIVPLTQEERDAALITAFTDFNNALTARAKDNPYYDAGNDASLKIHAETIAKMVRDGASPALRLPDDVIILGARGTSVFDAAIILSVFTEQPDLVDAFLERGANAKAPFPMGANAMDRVITLFLQTQRVDRSMSESAVAVLQKLMAAGGTLQDAKLVAMQLRTRTLEVGHLINTLMAADILNKAGLLDASLLDHMVRISDAERQALQARESIDDSFLQALGAPIVTEKFTDVIPGTPFDYTVKAGDNLWDIARKFRNAIGGADMNETLRLLAARNQIDIDAKNNASRVLKIGETLTVPVMPTMRVGSLMVEPFDVILGALRRIQPEFGDKATIDTVVQDFFVTNKIRTQRDLMIFLAQGENMVFKYTIDGVAHETKLQPTDVIEGFAFRRGYLRADAPSAQEKAKELRAYRDFVRKIADYSGANARDLLSGKKPMVLGETYKIVMKNDRFAHFDRLDAPVTADENARVDLIVIENGKTGEASNHAERTYSAALNSNYAINPSADLKRFHAWDGDLFSYGTSFSNNALRLMLNLDGTPLHDRVMFSFSMGATLPFKAADNRRYQQSEDNASFEELRLLLADMERARPIMFVATGNTRQASADGTDIGTGDYAASELYIHSPRTYLVGAGGKYPQSPTTMISEYSSNGGDVCTYLNTVQFAQEEGTSFATPNLAGVSRQMMEWYGNVLSFEEIMAAGMMVATRDIMDFDPFAGISNGNEADHATFQTNGAGLPVHARCGSGLLDRDSIKSWNETLKFMADKKLELNKATSAFETSVVKIGDAVETVADGKKTTYIYKVIVPENMTLDKTTFLLPQRAGVKGAVEVTMPSGFTGILPHSLNGVASTRIFNFEDVKKGDVIEIRTTRPLGQEAAIYLRGHADGNMIQVVRDYLRDKGVLHAPLQTLKGGVVKSNQPQLIAGEKAPNPTL